MGISEEDSWDCGVRTSPLYKPELPDTVALERNLLGVPLCVLNPRASKTSDDLIYEWSNDQQKAIFVLERPRHGAFPLPQHAVYLSVMVAMFAHNFKDDGTLRFKFADVVRNAGKDPKSRGAVVTVQETIRRYSTCTARWHYAWRGEENTWHGPIIISEDVWSMTTSGVKIKRNPRKTQERDMWHKIRFHPHIVQSVKAGLMRVFIVDALSGDLSAAAFCVYQYFYGFSDTSDVRRSLQHLMTVFPWQGQKNRFRGWLIGCLEELKAAGYVGSYDVADSVVAVRCNPINEVKRIKKNKEIQSAIQALVSR
jgi:hypothetical protein